jgi:enamine deaminase RidA (YjgF/YER057c/UK114 family)
LIATRANAILARSADFTAMNEVHKTQFPGGKDPARTTSEAKLAPEELPVEIECVAEVSEAGR